MQELMVFFEDGLTCAVSVSTTTVTAASKSLQKDEIV
jgi:hypothetical protein